MVEKLNNPGQIRGAEGLTAEKLREAIDSQQDVKEAIAALVKAYYQAEVADKSGGTDQGKDIDATDGAGGDNNKLKVELQPGGGPGTEIKEGTGTAVLEFTGVNKGVTVTIKIKEDAIGSLSTGSNNVEAQKIANKIVEAVKQTSDGSKNNRGAYSYSVEGLGAKTKIYVTVKMMLKIVVITYGW